MGCRLRRVALVLVLLAVAMSGGCAWYNPVPTPGAAVKSATLANQTGDASRVEVVIELSNESPTPLPLVQCDYTINVAGVGSFSFSDKPNRTLPGRPRDPGATTPGAVGAAGDGLQQLILPASFAAGGQNVKGAAYQVSGSVTYEPPTEMRKLLTDSYVPLPTVQFSGNGTIE